MPVPVLPEKIAQLAPHCVTEYRAAFETGQPVLERYGIADSRRRVVHFLTQILHETGGLALRFENLRYSPARLPAVWPSRFRPLGPLDPEEYAYQPEKLANAVYGGRMGNVAQGDGFLYRGRGMLQLTGKGSYARATTILQLRSPAAPDLTDVPDAVCSAEWCLHVAAAEWAARGCNCAADRDDIEEVTRCINGGIIGLPERIAWSAKVRPLFLPG
ncbi:MAG: lytic enzyme [Pseudomonadota bacterium]